METTVQVHARLSALPRAALGFFPTPFHRAENLSRELGVDLWLKRDDLTGMSLFGGNKVRKLEYVLGEARARGRADRRACTCTVVSIEIPPV